MRVRDHRTGDMQWAAADDYENGHVPVGQLEASPEPPPDFAANVDIALLVLAEPHFSHGWAFLLSAFSRKDVT